jgi:hypothetical protein
MTQPASPQSGTIAPMTVRGADGKVQAANDMKPAAATRIRPIIPAIFRLPN